MNDLLLGSLEARCHQVSGTYPGVTHVTPLPRYGKYSTGLSTCTYGSGVHTSFASASPFYCS